MMPGVRLEEYGKLSVYSEVFLGFHVQVTTFSGFKHGYQVYQTWPDEDYVIETQWPTKQTFAEALAKARETALHSQNAIGREIVARLQKRT